jgi:iron complex transport system substrate-binding protein
MRLSLRGLRPGAALLALALTVAGCGSGTVSDPGAEARSGSGDAAAITVDTVRGPVSLDRPATRVVSLEWAYTEELLALGVTPVGNADNSGYRTWVRAPGAELPQKVTDVGTRQEPSIERIRALRPDLIVADEGRIKANYQQLTGIAPVVSFDPTAGTALRTMKGDFTELAVAVGKREQARQVLDRMDATAREVKARLDEAGKAKARFALAQGMTVNGSPSIRMFTAESLAGQVLERSGLRNAWKGQADDWGMTTVGVEALTRIPGEATFLSVAAKADDPFTGALAHNPVWRDLGFVKADRAKPLDPGTWLFGGPLSAIQLLEESAKAFGA